MAIRVSNASVPAADGGLLLLRRPAWPQTLRQPPGLSPSTTDYG